MVFIFSAYSFFPRHMREQLFLCCYCVKSEQRFAESRGGIAGRRKSEKIAKEANVKIKLLGNNRLIILPFISLSHRLSWLLFQMRYTKKVSMWPVGLITKYGVSSPIVRNGTISGFYDGWIGGRKFPVDMAGFAVNVNFLLSRPNASMPYKPGYEEDGFLKSLSPLNLTEIELMATNCTQVCSSRRLAGAGMFDESSGISLRPKSLMNW